MKKLRTARALMLLSTFVIVCFQVYWLMTIYNDKYNSIQKNTDVVFRETLYKLQVDRFEKDSLFNGLPGENLFTVDMMNVLKKRINDTGHLIGNKKSIIITIDHNADTTIKQGLVIKDSFIRNNVFIRRGGVGPTFTRSIKDSSQLYDSIPLHVIIGSFKHELSKANIDIPFTISKINISYDTSKCNTAFCTGIVPVGLFGLIGYKAAFESPRLVIFKSIRLQILLSLLLVALVSVSFLFLYRNLIAQQRLSDIKNEFISNITHELKTPIATVNVAIEALQNFGALYDPSRTKEYLDISASELQRLSLLVDKVLKISMFEKKEITLEKEGFDIVQLFKEVMASMKLQFEKQHASFEIKLSGKNFIIDADKLHMTSVIYNLLDNALKYSKENSQIVVHVLDQTQYLEFRVIDNGIGIASEYTHKIFEKFFRVPAEDTQNAKGYGLGLSYVNHIIQRHQGFVEVESELNRGSTFKIKIPFAEAATIYYDNNRG
ncbi:MAG TPA: HAMP domain-containing sensor histidine kinase [Chitinophagaceae bacterium]|nr:HAMP domain-containing sensor histidine kinase [Chitinophagaceae bacterium]